MSDSLQPHELQHIRISFLSPTPGDYSNSWYSDINIIITVNVLPTLIKWYRIEPVGCNPLKRKIGDKSDDGKGTEERRLVR